MTSSLANLWKRRDLLWELVWGELRSTTAETRLGWFWWLLDPLLMMLVYWAFKELVFPGGPYSPYPIFLGAALLSWRHLTIVVSRAARTLSGNEALIRSVPFPTMLLPLAAAVAQLVFFLVSMIVLIGFAIALGRPATLTLLQILPLAFLQLLLVAGVALALTCPGALVPDLGEAADHILRILWFLSPGMYGMDLIRARFAGHGGPATRHVLLLFQLNPFAMLFEGYRGAVFAPAWTPLSDWLALTAEAVVVLGAGFAIYRRYDRRVLKAL